MQIENTYAFLKCIIPVGDNILSKISMQITDNFPDSLAIFYYCLGLFVDENPDMIGMAKRVIMSVAKRILNNDVTTINYQLSISIENIYLKNKPVLNLIYQEAICYGALVEKYDAISCGVKYHNHIVRRRYQEDTGLSNHFISV